MRGKIRLYPWNMIYRGQGDWTKVRIDVIHLSLICLLTVTNGPYGIVPRPEFDTIATFPFLSFHLTLSHTFSFQLSLSFSLFFHSRFSLLSHSCFSLFFHSLDFPTKSLWNNQHKSLETKTFIFNFHPLLLFHISLSLLRSHFSLFLTLLEGKKQKRVTLQGLAMKLDLIGFRKNQPEKLAHIHGCLFANFNLFN